MTETASQRALADVEKVAVAMFRADAMNDGEPWGKWAVHYRAMAVAAIGALGVREEQYRSAACPDDLDYDMVRLCSSWRPANPAT